jgi:iron complex transport system permease protein
MSAAEIPVSASTTTAVAAKRRPKAFAVFAALLALLVCTALLAATMGAAGIPLSRLWPARPWRHR